ncbi:MAG: DsrE family protein [Aquificaceae bacterium]|jgi:tRNA 2-thiouridine synthesizing protein C|uniref:DsrE family protein n=1 Tax=Hydrogenobacter sp. Uz 6-8 TaxID=3384828 RepID=UPI000F25846F|nr:MAG: sulfur reduction protein DsrE [Aquificota bacterium]
MKVALVIKGDPFSWKCHEAFRIAMALGISCDVNLIMIKDGVFALSRWYPEELGIQGFDRLLENMGYVRVKLYAEDASLEERGLKPEDLICKVEVKSIEELRDIIADSEAVLVW